MSVAKRQRKTCERCAFDITPERVQQCRASVWRDQCPQQPVNRDLLGREVFDPATGRRQGTLYHEPVEVEAEDPGEKLDARIRRQYDPTATPPLFPD